MWAHVPVLVNEERKKLSKRRDKVALEQYRDEGYLADAMVNYLMTLGWAPKGDTEIVPWSQIEDEFRLEDVTHSPAFFDLKKLTAFNGEYIRALPRRRVHRGLRAVAPRRTTTAARFAAHRPARCRRGSVTLAEAPAMVDFLFMDDPVDRRGVVGEGDDAELGRRRCSTRSSPPTRRRRGTAADAEGRRRGASATRSA